MDDSLTDDPRSGMLCSVLATVNKYSMLSVGDTVLVAVSGGPDSVALLHALWSIRENYDLSLHVAHLNHSFRGEDSDDDARYVASLAADLGLPCTVEKVDVPRVREALRLSPEEAARLVRYEFLETAADAISAHHIALGHTADDQVETVLMNILRGAGIDGLSGMPPVRGRIIRPLVEVRRSLILEYLAAAGITARTDETNLLPVYTRNRIRLELIPALRTFNPEVEAAVLHLAELARADAAYVSMEARKRLDQILAERAVERITLYADRLMALDDALKRRVVREAVFQLRGEVVDVSFRHIEELLRLVSCSTSFRYELPGGVFAERSGDVLTFHSQRPPEIPIIYRYEIAIPGRTEIPEAGLALETEVTSHHPDPVHSAGSMQAVLDSDAVKGPLVVRNWHPGDRIRPLGMKGSRKLQDIFTDRKIPRRARHLTPVIEDAHGIVWVVGLVVSETVKVSDATRSFLRLAAAPL